MQQESIANTITQDVRCAYTSCGPSWDAFADLQGTCVALQSGVCLSRVSRCPAGSGRSPVGPVETQCLAENMDGKVCRHTAVARETGMQRATYRFARSGMRVRVRSVPHSTGR